MTVPIFGKLRTLFSVPVDNMELVRAQFRAFSKQIPLLYLILIVNTLAVVVTYARFGHPWLSIYLPLALCVVCASRSVWWWRHRNAEVSDIDAIRHMRLTVRIAIVLALTFSLWGFALYNYGDAYARGEVAFFLALTMISCIFCLMHLRPAALSVAIVGVVPFSTYFFFFGQGHLRPQAINLALVAFGIVAILMIYSRDFASLVASQKSLIDKQVETQNLSDENLRLANLDSLSNLPNRRAVTARLEQCHDRPAQVSPGGALAQTAIVFVDLDGFKDVNDTYGHETGDVLIRIVARAFETFLPAGAMLARLGGDEFAILLSTADAEPLAKTFARDVLAHLEVPILIGERTIQIGASIGIACALPQHCSSQELFRRADTAMYYVKSHGKSGVKLYTPELDAERQRQAELEDEMRAGLARGEFAVHYQPIVDASTKAFVSVEALARWPGRPGGAIGPDDFIPIAESSGLIHPLGLFVLRRACEDFLAIPGVRLSVNISPAQFRDPDFEAKVAGVLRETGFPAMRLELELTEGYLIDHPERAAAAISSLKAMGVSVALDDFGTGYTSIAYLQRYGFNRIKIDKSLAGRIDFDKNAGVLVAGTVFLANGLDMTVTAEGVETQEQAQLLHLAGCQSLQGHLYSTARPLDDLLRDGLLQTADDDLPQLRKPA